MASQVWNARLRQIKWAPGAISMKKKWQHYKKRLPVTKTFIAKHFSYMQEQRKIVQVAKFDKICLPLYPYTRNKDYLAIEHARTCGNTNKICWD